MEAPASRASGASRGAATCSVSHCMVGEVDFVLGAHAAYIYHVHLPTRTLTVARASVSAQVQAAIYARW